MCKKTPPIKTLSCWLLFFGLFFPLKSISQELLANPSFEDFPEASSAPAGWVACNQFGTPDIQPGVWNVQLPPSSGNTYISLLARGMETPQGVTTEGLGQFLETELLPNKAYRFKIDIAQSPTFGIQVGPHQLLFDAPVRLRIWLGNDSCDPYHLAWESAPIQHQDWRTYQFYFANDLEEKFSFIFLEAVHADEIAHCSGNILLDNASLSPAGELADCSWYVPNIFSPNGDGQNDRFAGFGDCTPFDYQLLVFDRWGALVFEALQPEETWDGRFRGTNQPEGVYFWRLSHLQLIDGTPEKQVLTGSITLVR